MRIEAFVITPERRLAPVDAREMSDDWFLDETVRWIKITAATNADLEQALRPLELHPRIVTACTAIAAEPDVVVFEKALFVRLPVWSADDGTRVCVRFVSVATSLITIQDQSIGALDDQADRLQSDQSLLNASTAALMLDLNSVLMKSLVPGYIALRAEVEATENTLETSPIDVASDDLLRLKRRVSRLFSLLEDYSYCLAELYEARSDTLQLATVREGYQDLVGDVERAQVLVGRMENRIRDLRQSSLNYLQESTNRRLNVLAVLSAIYLPSTLIAGIYGMNFDNIPITRIPYGYFVVLAIMVGLVVGQLVFFYRRGWFR